MTKDEAYEVIDESLGGYLCEDCPYYIVGVDPPEYGDVFPKQWKDCCVDNPFHCPYVDMEVNSG
jgi:hypothetical protein